MAVCIVRGRNKHVIPSVEIAAEWLRLPGHLLTGSQQQKGLSLRGFEKGDRYALNITR
jgi:hypothetical protein